MMTTTLASRSLRICFIGLVLVILLGWSTERTRSSPNVESSTLVIEGAQIWDGTGKPLIQDGLLIIKNGRIDAVGKRSAVAMPKDAKVISATGRTIIPGLINAHGHVGLTKGLKMARANYTKENALAQLKLYARYGVTTVLSLGTDMDPIFEIRGPAKLNEDVRATVLTAGLGFTAKKGYPPALPDYPDAPRGADSIAEVKTAINQLAKQNVDVVKIWVDDNWGRYPKIRPEIYRAIINEAHNRNLRVMAHVFYLEDARRLVEAGIDGLAHSVRDREVDDALITLLKKKKVFLVPTLVREESTFIYADPPKFFDDPFFSRWADQDVVRQVKDAAFGARIKADPDFSKFPALLTMAQKNLKKLWDAGVKIAFGTDSGPPGRFQGYFEHRELELMVQAGLSPEQVLLTATRNAAECLHLQRDFGTLEKGKRADLILLDANPLEDILNSRKISKVWVGGREVN